jgi:hypothetical protein
MKASDIQIDYAKQSFLFKGPFGFGKTLAAASFAIDGPVFLSYWDKKSPVELVTFFKRFGDVGKKILENIEFETYSSQNANAYLNKLIDFASDCRYTAIINDSLTFMTSAAVNWSLNFGKETKERNIKNILPSWDEYKTETSLISQCIDISKKLPCHTIWTAHPLPTTRVEGSGGSMKVNKINSLVSYGSKVAGMVPGGFTEIYHFSTKNNWDSNSGRSTKQFIANLEGVEDEFAKSPMLGDYCKEIDFTDKLFYQVWKEQILLSQGKVIEIESANPIGRNI